MLDARVARETDRMLSYMSEEQLANYKEKLCMECLDIAKDFIQSAIDSPNSQFGVKVMKETYDFKKEIVRRILIAENLRFQKKHKTQGSIDLRKVGS